MFDYICAWWSFFQLKLPLPFCCFSYNEEKKEDYRKRLKPASCFSSLSIFCVLRKRDIACKAHQITHLKQQSFTNELK